MDKKGLKNFHRGALVRPAHIPGETSVQEYRRLINANRHLYRNTYDYTTPNQGPGPRGGDPRGGTFLNPRQTSQIRPDCALAKDLTEYETPMPTPCIHKSGLLEVTVRGERYYTCPTLDCIIYNKDQEYVQNHVDRIKPGATHPVYCRPLKEEGNRWRSGGCCGDYVPSPNQYKEYDDAVECVKSKQQINM